MLAPKPRPQVNDFDPSTSNERVRSEVRDTLAKIRRKAKTGGLSGDSALFRMKKKLSEFADVLVEAANEAEMDIETVGDHG